MNILKKTLYNLFRNYLKKHFTRNLGKVVEEEERLVCYVKKRKGKRDGYCYTIPCFGIDEKEQKLANDFQLNKPICYIIDGIKIEKEKVNIFGYNGCEVIVRNCKFNWGASIFVNSKCTLENTMIRSFRLLTISANDMTIKNMNLNHEMALAGCHLQITIGAEKLRIINSNIGEKLDTVKIDVTSSNELHMINSKIIGNEFKIKSSIIESDDKSSFIALKGADIETDDFQKVHIDSPAIVLNSINLSEYGKTIELDSVKSKRLELLEVLKKLRNTCTAITYEMAKNLLNNQSVDKILKK